MCHHREQLHAERYMMSQWVENIRALHCQHHVCLHSHYCNRHESSSLDIICSTSCFHLIFFHFPFHIPLAQGPYLILLTRVHQASLMDPESQRRELLLSVVAIRQEFPGVLLLQRRESPNVAMDQSWHPKPLSTPQDCNDIFLYLGIPKLLLESESSLVWLWIDCQHNLA